MDKIIGLRKLTVTDVEWVAQLWEERWGGALIIAHGQRFTPEMVEGIIANVDGKPAGLVTYFFQQESCEVVSLDSLIEHQGIGSLLLAAAVKQARERVCRRLFLVTTNDNLSALRFYQKQGLHLCALRPGAVDVARALKPSIPLLGEEGIPIHDELELEFDLNQKMPGESELDFD